jgi:hypothetical protein
MQTPAKDLSDSDFALDTTFTNEATEVLNLEDFDLSQESLGAWGLNIHGMGPSSFGHL